LFGTKQSRDMALTAKIVKVPVEYKLNGRPHLPGRIIKIFANRVVFSPALFTAGTVQQTFAYICKGLI
jgi:hypothetical protein